MIKQYLEHHFEPSPNDNFRMEPDWSDASFSRRVSGLSVRKSLTHRLQSVVVEFVYTLLEAFQHDLALRLAAFQ